MDDLSILIAGTSNSYLEISKKILNFHYNNCQVDIAYSGSECINKVTKNIYDLVLFDFNLGDLNGLDVINTLRLQGSKIPLIIMVDEGEDEIAIQSIEKGASDYIFKVRGYLTALPITIRNICERKNLTENEKTIIPRIETKKKTTDSEGFFILDRRGHILSVNYTMEKITHYTEDELVELNLFDLLPKEKEKSFAEWLNTIDDNGNSNESFKTEIVGKTGNKIHLDINLTAIKDEHQQVVSYRGKIEHFEEMQREPQVIEHRVNQLNMIHQISQAIIISYNEPLTVFLENIAELACQIFRFQRSTIALLDKKKKVFVKQSMVGYMTLPQFNGHDIEVPQEVIDRIFDNRYRVKVIYYDQFHRDTAGYISSKFPERRTQKRRLPNQWHKRDLILINLLNRSANSFGYISLDTPFNGYVPTRDTFHNLELFGQLVSTAIENYYQFSTLERRARRLKQLLVTSNIFKLYLSLNELLKEVVWSIKFSLEFNLVALGLISKRSGNLEMKAVACEDKIKMRHLSEIKIPLEPLAKLFRSEYNRGNSYLIVKEEKVLHQIKQIYYGTRDHNTVNNNWPFWNTLLVPIKSRERKIIGIILVDDPENNKFPNKEVVRTLEIFSNQVGVAIDNRILYVQTKNQISNIEKDSVPTEQDTGDNASVGIKGFVDRIFG